MWLRIFKFLCEQLTHSHMNLRYVVLVIAFLIQLDAIICSQFPKDEIYRSSLTEANQSPISLMSTNRIIFEPSTTLRSQEVYDEESTRSNSFVKGHILINNHKEYDVNMDDGYSKEYSTTFKPILSGDNKFSSEFTTVQNFHLNWVKGTSSEISTMQPHEVNENAELSTEFSTLQTQTHTNESHLIDKTEDSVFRKKSLLSSVEVLYENLSSVQNEIKEKFFNIENLIGLLTEDSSNYYLEFLNKNFINSIDGSVHCRDDDLLASFECLKLTLQRLIRYLTKQRVLTIFDTVHLVRNPEAETRLLQRSFDSDIWDTIATFLRSRTLKVTTQGVSRSSAAAIVTTARMIENSDNSSRFEVGVELPHESEYTEITEGRESKKKKLKKIKKALLIALMAKIAALMMAVLGGAVILAKKALIVAAVSLVSSSITASKKATPSAYTGDYDHGRLGRASYIDLNTGTSEYYDKYIGPTSQDYQDNYYPNVIPDHERIYAKYMIGESPVAPQSQFFSTYKNDHDNYEAGSDFYGITQLQDGH